MSLAAAGFVLWVRGGQGFGVCWVKWWDGLIFYDVVIGGCMEYNVSDGQDGKSGCRVLFTGQGINYGVWVTAEWGIYARLTISSTNRN